jgi:pyridoxine 4-dehydrogenase
MCRIPPKLEAPRGRDNPARHLPDASALHSATNNGGGGTRPPRENPPTSVTMTKHTDISAAQSGTFHLGHDLPVHRLGFGAMRITGEGVWGPPRDHGEAIRVLRRAVELGINLIDTAESYGPHVSEELIAEALHPYPEGLVIATKGGFDRTGPGEWRINCRPERLREELEGSLRRLRLERIDLWQLHRIDPDVPEEDQFGAIQEFVREGKVRHVGLSEVTVEQIESARKYFRVVSVQNRYNLADREWEATLDHCEREGIGFIPWYPLNVGKLATEGGVLAEVAERHGAAPAQVALAWLLARSPVMLPIPGTSRVRHLEENTAAAGIQLSVEEVEWLG